MGRWVGLRASHSADCLGTHHAIVVALATNYPRYVVASCTQSPFEELGSSPRSYVSSLPSPFEGT